MSSKTMRLLQLAKKTLSRDEDDKAPVPPHYLRILDEHLKKYPSEEDFTIDLEDAGGTVTCLRCWKDLIVATNGKLKDFKAFWVSSHLARLPNLILVIDVPCCVERTI